jgi:hypothetical protein
VSTKTRRVIRGSPVLFCGDRALGEEFAQEALARAQADGTHTTGSSAESI